MMSSYKYWSIRSHIHTYIHTHTYTHTYIHTYIHTIRTKYVSLPNVADCLSGLSKSFPNLIIEVWGG